MTTAQDQQSLPEEVFGESDSEWNIARGKLEAAALLAAAELIAHAGASWTQIQGHGVTLEIRVNDDATH